MGMKKIEENGFTVTTSKSNVKIEISISNLVNAFNSSPNNYSPDGEKSIKIKQDRKEEFANFIAEQILEQYDPDTGMSVIENAIETVFLEIFEGYEDFAEYPE